MPAARSAEELLAVVRVHADRVHDAVRRLGVPPGAAAEVVEHSALELIDAVARRPATVPDEVGLWVARARSRAQRATGGGELPVGGGVLAADADQEQLARALALLPQDQRLALLLRDAYALPAVSVGVALGQGPDAAMDVVARARLAFLGRATGRQVPGLAAHGADLPALARLGEGGPVAAGDATTRRHAQSCAVCRAVLEAQDEAHRTLAALAVVALPDADRDALLRRAEVAARAALPAAASLTTAEAMVAQEQDDDEPRRLLTPLAAVLAVLLAVAAGVGIGLLLVRDPGGIDPQAAAAGHPLITAEAAPSALVAPRGSFDPGPAVVVTTLPVQTLPPPSPSPSPSPLPSATPSPRALALAVTPSSGPSDAALQIQGAGWTPGVPVSLSYLDPAGAATGSAATATPDATGRFTAVLTAHDPANLPGPHTVSASDGAASASARYDVTG